MYTLDSFTKHNTEPLVCGVYGFHARLDRQLARHVPLALVSSGCYSGQ